MFLFTPNEGIVRFKCGGWETLKKKKKLKKKISEKISKSKKIFVLLLGNVCAILMSYIFFYLSVRLCIDVVCID